MKPLSFPMKKSKTLTNQGTKISFPGDRRRQSAQPPEEASAPENSVDISGAPKPKLPNSTKPTTVVTPFPRTETRKGKAQSQGLAPLKVNGVATRLLLQPLFLMEFLRNAERRSSRANPPRDRNRRLHPRASRPRASSACEQFHKSWQRI